MLENIRESSQGWTAKIILGLVVLTFAVAGVGSYSNSVDTSVAEVNGESISQNDFDKAYQAQRGRMAQQYGEMFEQLSADTGYMNNFRNGVLDNLISQKLIDQNSQDMGIRVSDQRIKQTITQMQEFQVDGTFDNNRYLAVINQAGFFQPSDFRDYLRIEMTRRQFTQALVASEFELPYQGEMLTALQDQKRDLRYAVITAEQFKATVEVTDEEINNYFQENQSAFENPEQVKVDYVLLDVNEVALTIEVSDDDIEQYYRDNIAAFTTQEKRRISHILVELTDDKSASKTKIDTVIARLSAGEDFAELAKELSDDTFSGEKGGDLEWLERDVMDKPFEDAALALVEVGDTTAVVETSFGYHVIKLTDLEAETVKALSEVKAELAITLKNDRAQNRYVELRDEMATLSFEVPDTLDDAASAIDSDVRTSEFFSRGNAIAPFNNPKVIEAAFSELVLNEQTNSDVIELSDEVALVIHINDHKPANVKQLSEVSESIKTMLTSQKASASALAKANELLTQFKAGTDITEALSGVNSEFVEVKDVARYGSELDSAINRQVFTLAHPSEGVVSAATVNLSNGDLALLELQAVNAAEVTEVNPELAQRQVSQLAQSAYQNYIDTLKVDAKIIRRGLGETSSIN